MIPRVSIYVGIGGSKAGIGLLFIDQLFAVFFHVFQGRSSYYLCDDKKHTNIRIPTVVELKMGALLFNLNI